MARCGFLIVLAVGWIGPRPVEAAAKKFVLTPAEARTFVAWSHYLSAGPQTWSSTHAPAFTPAIRSTIWQVVKTDTQSQQLANPMIDYLLWRQSLDPKRFAAYHPNLSPRLAQLLNAPTLPSGVPPSDLHAGSADRGVAAELDGPIRHELRAAGEPPGPDGVSTCGS